MTGARQHVTVFDAEVLALTVDDARRRGAPMTRREVVAAVAALPTVHDLDDERDPS